MIVVSFFFPNTHFLFRTQVVTIWEQDPIYRGLQYDETFSYKLIVKIKYEQGYNLYSCL